MNPSTVTKSVRQEPKATMAIIEKFDGLARYLYPKLTNTSRVHRVMRDEFLKAIFDQYKLFHAAGKSGQVSRLYEADAGLAYIRELLRFMSWSGVKQDGKGLMSLRQYEIASVHLAETGAMLGAWIAASQKRSVGG